MNEQFPKPDPQQIDTESYLKRIRAKKEEVSEEELIPSFRRLQKPFKAKEREKRAWEMKVGKATLLVDYGPPEEKNGKLAHRITKCVFKNKEDELDILGVLPKDTEIFIGGWSFSSTDGGITQPIEDEGKHRQEVYLRSMVRTPYTLIVFLHELGHVFDIQNLIDQGLKTPTSDHPDSNIAEWVRKERSANAFVLKIMRAYVSDKKMKEDILTVINSEALHGTYKQAKEELAYREERRERKA